MTDDTFTEEKEAEDKSDDYSLQVPLDELNRTVYSLGDEDDD